MWYSNAHLLSYNKLLNFAVGPRGTGKSVEGKRWALHDFIKHGRQFVYLRRTETELDRVKNQFFTDMESIGFWPKHEFSVRVVGEDLQFYVNDEVAGYGMAMSTAHKHRSNTFPYVNKIIFDEFLLEKGVSHYLSNEPEKFLALYETIARLRYVRAMFIANATSVNNPYFDYWNIKIPEGAKFVKGDEWAVEVYYNEDFARAKRDTPFGRLISGTPYGEYMIANEWLNDTNSFIEPMTGPAIYQYTIFYEGKTLGVWHQPTKGRYHVNRKVDPSCKTLFAFTTEDHKNNTILFKSAKTNPMIKRLKFAFDNNSMYVDSQSTKATMFRLFDYL